MNLDKTGNCVIFRSAERTYRTAEYKTDTVVR